MRYLLKCAAVTVMLAGAGLPVVAQTPTGILRQKAIRQQKLKQQQKQKMLPLPAPVVQRFLQMSPEDRERALAKLPPERRQQMEERLNRLQQLPPDQVERLQGLYPAFMNLRPLRRQAVRTEIQELRKLKPVERKERLNADAREFSPEEMDILRQVTGIPE
jgi:uncharacterized protein DUF3106